jgi:glycerophosphoryl diester phosphodiesterase
MTFVSFYIAVFGLASVLTASLSPRYAHPQIVAHRGACGYLPEHSLPAHQLAIDLKADYVEPDLCLTKDGIFVVMHDVLLDDTTNVASFPEFADRKTTKNVQGKSMTGFFVGDFTLSEIRQLRLRQRLSGTRTTLYDNLFSIPTFDEIMSLAQSTYSKTGRMIGIYPELKETAYHKSLGFPMVDMFLTSLVKGGYEIKGENVSRDLSQVVPVLVQCFESEALLELKEKSDLPLLQLIGAMFPSDWTEEKVGKLASYASAIGPEKSYFLIFPYETVQKTVKLIHSHNLIIHPWTFRADGWIEKQFQLDFQKEQMFFYCCLGVDGLFTEFPDQTRDVIDVMKVHQRQFPGECPIDCTIPQLSLVSRFLSIIVIVVLKLLRYV